MPEEVTQNLKGSLSQKGKTKGNINPNEAYGTEAVREIASGKGRYDLISPIAIRRLAGICENGAIKYAPRNWEKGIPMSRLLDSAIRHINQYREGLTDEDHLAQGFWNIMAALHTEEMVERGLLPKKLYDIPSYVKKELTSEEIQEACNRGMAKA